MELKDHGIGFFHSLPQCLLPFKGVNHLCFSSDLVVLFFSCFESGVCLCGDSQLGLFLANVNKLLLFQGLGHVISFIIGSLDLVQDVSLDSREGYLFILSEIYSN